MKTAIQEVFSDLEKLHPNLFNVYTTEGKEFINHYHKYLEIEKEQIYKALCRGHSDCGVFTMQSECDEYYNETYKKTDK
jgi:hemerythrin-like domain-containing protein